jgi:predicted DNA-binding antitoxin AbrB/MazE fold protein
MNSMVHNIDAIYDHGVFRPVVPLSLPEGVRVHLRVEEENGTPATTADYREWLGNLSGRWQGQFNRGNEGELETREPLG